MVPTELERAHLAESSAMPFHWYLLIGILLTDDTAATTMAVPYASQAECMAQGVARTEESMKDAKVKDILWTCVSVDFSPAPQERPPPKDKGI